MKPKLIAAVLFFLIPLQVFGLCFVPATPCEWYAAHHGQPTFIGTAVSTETVSDVLQVGEHATPGTVQKVTFKVEEPFEDTSSRSVTVYGFGTTNDFHFQEGVRYLVYAWRGKDGKIRTGDCTRTAPVSEAAEDIHFLRSLPAHVGGRILGLVRFVSPEEQNGTVTGMITESGKDGDHTTRVASSGLYEVDGLVPGSYRETFTPDDDSTAFVTLDRSIPVNGSCAGSGVLLGDATVSGNVLDQKGMSVPGAEVFLYYALDGRYHPDVFLETRTNAAGGFTFHRVSPAKFILATQVGSSGMTFLPSTQDASKTDVIEVLDGKPLSGFTIRVPRASRAN
jgi:hypothetical protein